MATRAELKRAYKETPKRAGVFQIKNAKSGRVLLGSSKNLHGPLNRHKFQLAGGLHPNALLQEEWNRDGADAFSFEVLEEVKVTDDPDFSLDDALAALEEAWVARLQPFGERGYSDTAVLRE